MSYERRRKNGEDHGWHLEGVPHGGCSSVDGERDAGGHGEGGVRLVAPGVSGDSDEFRGDGECRQTFKGGRKAFETAMEWLFNPESNPNVWMLDGVVTRDWAGRYIR